MKLAPKLIVGFSTVIIAIICVWIILLFQLNQAENNLSDLQDNDKELEKSTELNDLAINIQYYDEMLTQSARNYAFTEDVKWKERYSTDEPKLDKMIKRSNEIGDENDREFFASINSANLVLVEMEYKSIELVDQGKPADAVNILESAQYWDLKKMYAQGLANYTVRHGSMESSWQYTQTTEIVLLTAKIRLLVSNMINVIVISIPIILTLSTIFIIMIYRGVSKHVNRLPEKL